MKRIFFLFGIVFVALAFVGAAVEVAARAMTSDLGWLPSMGKVWGTVSPTSLQAFVEAHPWKGWARLFSLSTLSVFGLPGFFMVLVCRRQEEILDPEQETALFLFDELVKHAQEEDLSDLESLMRLNEQADQDSVAENYAQDCSDSGTGPKRDFLLGPKTPRRAINPED